MATATTTRKKFPARKTPGPLKDIYQDMTDKVLALMDQGTVIWHKQWKGSTGGGPRNLASKKLYRGMNIFILNYAQAESGFTSSWWGTYKQIQERGGQVRKGERSTQVIFWKILRKEDVVDGKPVKKTIPLLRTYNVFNTNQADWPEGSRPPVEAEADNTVDPIEAAEALIAEYLATGPSLVHGGDVACYIPAFDRIMMPQRNDFESADAYYSTLYHEATHSTGHTKRLARDGIAEGTFGRFGDPVYSREELVAEMGAAMLSGIAGIDLNTIESNAAYLAHWRDVLKGDNKLIIQAAAQAQKAADLILGTTFDTDTEEES